jgi:hypothetical protein
MPRGPTRVPNGKAKTLVKDRIPFNGSNVFGRRLQQGYCVYSYSEEWPIYLYYQSDWYGATGYRSATTQRHKSQLCPDDVKAYLPRPVLQLFVAMANTYYSNVADLDRIIRSCFPGCLLTADERQRDRERFSTASGAIQVSTPLARATVDWEAVRRRRVMPV